MHHHQETGFQLLNAFVVCSNGLNEMSRTSLPDGCHPIQPCNLLKMILRFAMGFRVCVRVGLCAAQFAGSKRISQFYYVCILM